MSFSPDGLFAYVAANNSDAVSAFARNPATGALTQLAGTLACIQDTTAHSGPAPQWSRLGYTALST